MTDATIKINKSEHEEVCHSCGGRNYEAYTKPVDVDELFEVGVGNRIIVFCAPCLQVLAQVIHPHRTGS